MLILTRRINETIVIGKNKEITIKIFNVKGEQVCIGIQAAKDVPVMREELLLRSDVYLKQQKSAFRS